MSHQGREQDVVSENILQGVPLMVALETTDIFPWIHNRPICEIKEIKAVVIQRKDKLSPLGHGLSLSPSG